MPPRYTRHRVRHSRAESFPTGSEVPVPLPHHLTEQVVTGV